MKIIFWLLVIIFFVCFCQNTLLEKRSLGIHRARSNVDWHALDKPFSREKQNAVMRYADLTFASNFLRDTMGDHKVFTYFPLLSIGEEKYYLPVSSQKALILGRNYTIPLLIHKSYPLERPYLSLFLSKCGIKFSTSNNGVFLRSFYISLSEDKSINVQPFLEAPHSNSVLNEEDGIYTFNWNTKPFQEVNDVCIVSVMSRHSLDMIGNVQMQNFRGDYVFELSVKFNLEKLYVFSDEWFQYHFGFDALDRIFSFKYLITFQIVKDIFKNPDSFEFSQVKRRFLSESSSKLRKWLVQENPLKNIFKISRKDSLYGYEDLLKRYDVGKLCRVPNSGNSLKHLGYLLDQIGSNYIKSRRSFGWYRNIGHLAAQRFGRFVQRLRRWRSVKKLVHYAKICNGLLNGTQMSSEEFIDTYKKSIPPSFTKRIISLTQEILKDELEIIVLRTGYQILKPEGRWNRFFKFLTKQSLYNEKKYLETANQVISNDILTNNSNWKHSNG
jgi:hypothetical protein